MRWAAAVMVGMGALSGCGGPLVAAAQGGDPVKVRRAVELATRLLEDSGQWRNPTTGLLLTVHPETKWIDYTTVQGAVMGLTVWPDRFEVGSDLAALLHEALHVQDWQRLRFPSAEHCHDGWDEDGRNGLSGLYRSELFHPGTGSLAGLPPELASALRQAGWGQAPGEAAPAHGPASPADPLPELVEGPSLAPPGPPTPDRGELPGPR